MQHWALAVDRVRYSGEPVAVVLDDDRYLAEDALDAVRVEYRALPATVDIAEACEADAPVLHDAVGSNVINERHFRYGEPEQAFAGAARRVALTVHYPRNSCTPIEGASCGRFSLKPTAAMPAVLSNFMGRSRCTR
jgi:2-furoyl-CoA dehydrogenase large subunit